MRYHYDLTGSYDLHVHTAPDVIPRRLGGPEMAQQAMRAGMRGFALKNHHFPTAQSAEGNPANQSPPTPAF